MGSTHNDRFRGWALYLGCWVLVALLFAFGRATDPGSPAVSGFAIGSELCRWLLWAALAPGILRATQWISSRRGSVTGHPIGKAVLHGFSALVFSSFATVLLTLTFAGLQLLQGSGPLGAERLQAALDRVPPFYNLLTYLAIAAAIHTGRFFDRSRGRAMRTTALEAQLAQARLQALKAQLHPHFLFNTLNAISALMHRDVESADRMIALLSDLLRVSLDKDDRHQVSLREELAILERYLAIERIRFRDRLRIEIDVERPCYDALIPRLILQPLVENSVIHGIALQSTAGLISIRARRTGNRLSVTVADDGPGLLEESPLKEGVGLSNTRARLAELYGSDHRLTLERATVGGLEVGIEVPFEFQPRFPDGSESATSGDGTQDPDDS